MRGKKMAIFSETLYRLCQHFPTRIRAKSPSRARYSPGQ